jgi:hypothetical protein
VSFKLHSQDHNVSLVFFGFHCRLTGYLVFKPALLPGIPDVLLTNAGEGDKS